MKVQTRLYWSFSHALLPTWYSQSPRWIQSGERRHVHTHTYTRTHAPLSKVNFEESCVLSVLLSSFQLYIWSVFGRDFLLSHCRCSPSLSHTHTHKAHTNSGCRAQRWHLHKLLLAAGPPSLLCQVWIYLKKTHDGNMWWLSAEFAEFQHDSPDASLPTMHLEVSPGKMKPKEAREGGSNTSLWVPPWHH